jgi:esterase/lipase superfamily enzyme
MNNSQGPIHFTWSGAGQRRFRASFYCWPLALLLWGAGCAQQAGPPNQASAPPDVAPSMPQEIEPAAAPAEPTATSPAPMPAATPAAPATTFPAPMPAAPGEEPTFGSAAPAEPGSEPFPNEAPNSASPGNANGNHQVVNVYFGTDRAAVVLARHFPLWTALATAVLLGLAAWRRTVASIACASLGVLFLGWVLLASPRPTREFEFGGGRGEMAFGVCEVSIPGDSHQIGVLESPSLLRLEFQENPEKHVMVQSMTRLDRDAFYEDVKQIGAASEKSALIFVHGYNVSFPNAARRTAQLAYDLEFNGIPLFFSWPSEFQTLKYPTDEANVEWAVVDFTRFLQDLIQRADLQQIHLIAHSMGNRALTKAVIAVSRALKEDEKSRIHEIILTAPDIDADTFKRDIYPQMKGIGSRITLYASSNDRALQTSQKLHSYRRLGEAGANLLVLPPIETIDVSDLDTSLIGHSYYGDAKSVISDMYSVLRGVAPEDRFGLRRMELDGIPYWAFRR